LITVRRSLQRLVITIRFHGIVITIDIPPRAQALVNSWNGAGTEEDSPALFHYAFGFVPHLACAAFSAISFLRLGVRAADRAFPPFNPPLRPNATAAEFFPKDEPIASSTMRRAFWNGSRLLERLGMRL